MSETKGSPGLNAPNSIRILLDGAIDYAGLFPPAGLDMEAAVGKYAEHRRKPHHWMLGRFVVPVSRLEEFNFSALDFLNRDDEHRPWLLTALAGAELRADLDRIAQFNNWHGDRREGIPAVIDVVEIKAQSPQMIEAAARIIPDRITTYFEIPIDEDPDEMIDAICRVNCRVKVRTGGVTPEMFPAARDLARLILSCHENDVVIKATAGLHHPLCSVRKLTYGSGGPEGRMYGFLNLFIAAACARESMGDDVLLEVLEEESVHAFAFDDFGIRWNGHFLSTDVLEAVRSRSVAAFGSCSVDEAIGDLKGLRLL